MLIKPEIQRHDMKNDMRWLKVKTQHSIDEIKYNKIIVYRLQRKINEKVLQLRISYTLATYAQKIIFSHSHWKAIIHTLRVHIYIFLFI